MKKVPGGILFITGPGKSRELIDDYHVRADIGNAVKLDRVFGERSGPATGQYAENTYPDLSRQAALLAAGLPAELPETPKTPICLEERARDLQQHAFVLRDDEIDPVLAMLRAAAGRAARQEYGVTPVHGVESTISQLTSFVTANSVQAP